MAFRDKNMSDYADMLANTMKQDSHKPTDAAGGSEPVAEDQSSSEKPDDKPAEEPTGEKTEKDSSESAQTPDESSLDDSGDSDEAADTTDYAKEYDEYEEAQNNRFLAQLHKWVPPDNGAKDLQKPALNPDGSMAIYPGVNDGR